MSKATVQALSDSTFPDVGPAITPADIRAFNNALIADYQEELQQLTQAEIDALTPDLGQIVFNTDLANYCFWNGSMWKYFVTNAVNLAEIRTVKVTVTSAEILDAYDTPIELIAAPPSGFYIDPISITARFDYDSTPYATNTNGLVKIGSGTINGLIPLSTSNSLMTKMALSGFGFSGAMTFTVEDGNPTAGDSDLIFYITYQVVQL
jgi:hypothetical protein